MKLTTFNIRLDCGADGINNFCHRKNLILDKIFCEDPDILCFQEVLPHVAKWLKENLRNYYIVGCPRGNSFDDEQTCIAYRADRFELLKMDCYWLSPTPYIPASRYPDQSPCPRICTEVTFHELSGNIVFRLINTHLDHSGQEARRLGLEQIFCKLEKESFFPGVPTLLVGDMNAEPDSEEIHLVTREQGWTDLTEGIGPTFHGFGNAVPVHIDYIFSDRMLRCTKVKKWTECQNGIYLSDHYPVSVEIEL